MITRSIRLAIIPITFVLLSILILTDLSQVPFHPDEASLLFQSRDLEGILSDPLKMGWREDWQSDNEQTYRALNAPLAKYVLGIGRRAAGFTAQDAAVDWDWAQDWAQNVRRGAFPNEKLLQGARFASALAVLAAAAVTFLNGNRIGGRAAGWGAALFLGLNSLALLHGRRAMSEGVLLFTVSLAFLGFLEANRRPWFAGVATALAFSSKYSVAPLFLIGLIATQFPADDKPIPPRVRVRSTAYYLLGFGLVVWILHPFLWPDPIEAVKAMLDARGSLLASQSFEIGLQAPNQILKAWPLRLTILVGQLTIAPLQFSEVGNYVNDIQPSVTAYLASPLRSMARNMLGGGFVLAVGLIGVILTGIRWRKISKEFRRGILILIAASIAQIVILVAVVPLPFQRFYIPLLPLLALWIGLAVSAVWSAMSENESLEI